MNGRLMDQAPDFVSLPVLQSLWWVLCDPWFLKPWACSTVPVGGTGFGQRLHGPEWHPAPLRQELAAA